MRARIDRPNLLLQSYIVDQLVGGLLAEAMSGGDLTPGEFAVQSVIGVFGPIMPSELAQELGIPATTLSAHLRRFTERGHLERTPNPRDGRSYLVTLTDTGRAAVEAGRTALERTLKDVHAELGSGESDAVAAALTTFERALRAAQARRTTVAGAR
jgi:DNA-binding MarR family transcriptional regulator